MSIQSDSTDLKSNILDDLIDEEEAFEEVEDDQSVSSAPPAAPVRTTIDTSITSQLYKLTTPELATVGVLSTYDRRVMASVSGYTASMAPNERSAFLRHLTMLVTSPNSYIPPGKDCWQSLPVATFAAAMTVKKDKENRSSLSLLNLAFEPSLLYTNTVSGGRLAYGKYGAQLFRGDVVHNAGSDNALISRSIIFGKPGKMGHVTLSSSTNLISEQFTRYASLVSPSDVYDTMFAAMSNFTRPFATVTDYTLAQPVSAEVRVPQVLAVKYAELTKFAETNLTNLTTWAAYDTFLKGKTYQYSMFEFQSDRQYREVLGNLSKDSCYKSAIKMNAINTVRKWFSPLYYMLNSVTCKAVAVGHSKANRWSKLLALFDVPKSGVEIKESTTFQEIFDAAAKQDSIQVLPNVRDTVALNDGVELTPDPPPHISDSPLEDLEKPFETPENADPEGAGPTPKQIFTAAKTGNLADLNLKDLLDTRQRAAYVALADMLATKSRPRYDLDVLISDVYVPPPAAENNEISSKLHTVESWSWKAQLPLYKAYAKIAQNEGFVICKVHPISTHIKGQTTTRAGSPSYAWMAREFAGLKMRVFFDTRPHNGELIIYLAHPDLLETMRRSDTPLASIVTSFRPITKDQCDSLTKIVIYRMKVANYLRNYALTYGLPHLGVEHPRDVYAEFLVNDDNKSHVPSSEYVEATEEDVIQKETDLAAKKKEKKGKKLIK